MPVKEKRFSLVEDTKQTQQLLTHLPTCGNVWQMKNGAEREIITFLKAGSEFWSWNYTFKSSPKTNEERSFDVLITS